VVFWHALIAGSVSVLGFGPLCRADLQLASVCKVVGVWRWLDWKPVYRVKATTAICAGESVDQPPPHVGIGGKDNHPDAEKPVTKSGIDHLALDGIYAGIGDNVPQRFLGDAPHLQSLGNTIKGNLLTVLVNVGGNWLIQPN
jgi:hypothetical protein